VKPLLLRRTKKEILSQLPEKQETKVSIAFETKQKKLYRDIAISYNEKIQATIKNSGESKCQLQMLTALLRLRQACSDPAALPDVQYIKMPPKLETLLESLKEVVASDESALVFTQFLPTLMRTEKALKEAGLAVYTIHGGVSAPQRQKILKEFDLHPQGAVLLMTLKTGGVGLNLTKASYVFHIEPWWNPAVENQATDRAHRMGQEKSVQVFRYIMHESVEEKIELLKGRKDQQFKSLFSDLESASEMEGAHHRGLTKADFDLLLGGL
jgi:SNF2 family DNA or RNA helicase